MRINVQRCPVPIHAETFAKALGAKLVDPNDEDAYECDWYMMQFITPASHQAVAECNSRGVRTIGYWIGSDSWRALKDGHIRKMIPNFDVEFCVHKRIQDELHAWKRDPVILSSPVRVVPEPTGPTPPLVGVYMPHTKGVYSFHRVVEIAQRVPHLPFVFYGAQLPTLPENCANVGPLTPEGASELLRSFSVVLRICDHDGFPQNVIETKMLGKNAITNYPYEGCFYGDTDDKIVELLNDLRTHQPDFSEWPSLYRQNCSPSAFHDTVMETLNG